MSQLPKISIIAINHNQEEVTCEMLESLRHITYPNIEIFLVDNASKSDANSIKERYPEIILMKSPTNVGFTGGNNVAMKIATGDYIMLLNNDTVVSPGFIEPMLDTFAKHPDAGIVTPKIIFEFSDNLIQYAGTNEINPYTCRGETRGYKHKNDGTFDKEYKTHLCHGACMMISRACMDKIGILDDTFFIYYEEYDYCYRAKKAGFEIYYNGLSSILHKQSVTSGVDSPFKSYYMTKNRIYFSRKHFSGLVKLSALAYIYALALPKNIIKNLLNGRKENSVAIVKGAWWNLNNKVQPI